MKRHKVFLGALLVIALALAPTYALAADNGSSAQVGSGQSSRLGYSASGTETVSNVQKPEEARASNLPVTGYDLINVLAVGVILLGIGFGMSRFLGREANRR